MAGATVLRREPGRRAWMAVTGLFLVGALALVRDSTAASVVQYDSSWA